MSEQSHADLIQQEAPSPPLFRGVLLGLPPLLVIISALGMRYLASVCANDLIILLQIVAVALWGIELLAGIFCLFNRRLRSLAIGLILTLLFSVLLLWPLVQLSSWLMTFGPPFFCRASG